MKIYATCKCCVKKNFIIDNYISGGSFSQKSEFGIRLFNSLLEHLRDLQKSCQEQGHYDKIEISLDEFVREEEILPKELLEEFLNVKDLKKLKKARGEEKIEERRTLEEWFTEFQAEKQGINQIEYEKLKIILKGKEEEKLTWEEIQKILHPEENLPP